MRPCTHNPTRALALPGPQLRPLPLASAHTSPQVSPAAAPVTHGGSCPQSQQSALALALGLLRVDDAEGIGGAAEAKPNDRSILELDGLLFRQSLSIELAAGRRAQINQEATKWAMHTHMRVSSGKYAEGASVTPPPYPPYPSSAEDPQPGRSWQPYIRQRIQQPNQHLKQTIRQTT